MVHILFDKDPEEVIEDMTEVELFKPSIYSDYRKGHEEHRKAIAEMEKKLKLYAEREEQYTNKIGFLESELRKTRNEISSLQFSLDNPTQQAQVNG